MNVEENRRVYEGKDASCGYQLVSVSQYATEVLAFACLTVSKASWVQGRGSYAVILLVSIAKFNGMSVHCLVALFSAFYVYSFEHLVRILLHVDNLRKRYIFTEI